MVAFIKAMGYLVALSTCVLLPVKLTNYLYYKKKIRINRWVYGITSPFLLVIPTLIYDEVPKVLFNILFFFFFFLVMMFFETSRILVENNKLQGMFDYSKFMNKNAELMKRKNMKK